MNTPVIMEDEPKEVLNIEQPVLKRRDIAFNSSYEDVMPHP